MNRKVAFMLVLLAISAPMSPAHSQAYPNKPVRLLVGFAPGGIADTMTRILASKLTEAWSMAVQVENRPGAGGSIAAGIAAKAPADGYTLMSCDVATHAIDAVIYSNLPYDPLKDFVAITHIGSAPNVLVVGSSVDLHSLTDFLAYAKANPGRLSVASADAGTSQNLSTHLLKHMAAIDIVPIPYKGGGPAMTDLLGGQVPCAFASLSAAMAAMKSGKARALGVTSLKRSPQVPDVPAIAEVVPGYSVTSWRGICAPAGLSNQLAMKIYGDVKQAVESAEVRQSYAKLGIDAEAMAPEQFQQHIKSEIEKWRPVVKAAGVASQ